MTASKLCGRITDHPRHYWTIRGHSTFDSEGFLHSVEHVCPGRVVVEGGSCARTHRNEETR